MEITTLRFEKPNLKIALKEFLKSEKRRVIQNDKDTDFKVEDKQLFLQIKMSEWNEDADTFSVKKQIMRNRKEMKKELKYGSKSIVEVRRAALKNLLTDDYVKYKKELKELDKAVFVKRI